MDYSILLVTTEVAPGIRLVMFGVVVQNVTDPDRGPGH